MQAIVRLHEDSDFQQDANDPAIEPALDIMRADPQAMERYEGNARMMRVLYKLRGFQVRSSAPSGHPPALQDPCLQPCSLAFCPLQYGTLFGGHRLCALCVMFLAFRMCIVLPCINMCLQAEFWCIGQQPEPCLA